MIRFFLLFISLFTSVFGAEYKIIGYYPNWAIYRNPEFKPQHIDGNLITYLNYAFIRVDEKGNLKLFDPWADVEYYTPGLGERPYYGNFAQLDELKKKYPHLKTLFSVGGWTLSEPFSQMASDPQARQNFIKQSLLFCEKYHFDGIDIDWEYPCFADHQGRPEDKENFTTLLKELSIASKAHHPPLLVTIAAPAGPHHMKNIEIEKIHQYLDWINLMTYDFSGPWEPLTGHHAPLYGTKQSPCDFNADSAVTSYLNQGVPSSKIVLGIPLYGRTFLTNGSKQDGLYCPHLGPGTATTEEPGMRFFYDVKKNILKTYTLHWDSIAKVPYLCHPQTKEFITYEDEKSIAIKCQYLKNRKLGGAMVWELGLDVRPSWDAMKTIKDNL